MRVIGGKAKGAKLAAVPGSGTRPILDRVKTSLFDILRPEIEGAVVLDLFAGTGAVGIEALSQGAARCFFIERGAQACAVVRKNLEKTRLSGGAELLCMDAFRFLRETEAAFDLIYVAPPQYRGLWLKSVEGVDDRPELLAPRGHVVVQIDPREYKSEPLQHLAEQRQRRYGNTLLVFFGRKSQAYAPDDHEGSTDEP